ncbi:MAG: hypothetical protein JWM18_1640, partial [Chloroflexi bacterium]|nr:hypothetical protein [Chloroflexota bacterium]
MSPAPPACVHVAAGRARFLGAAIGGDPERAAHVEHELMQMAAVRAVRTHPRSGNVVVWFDAAATGPDELGAVLARALRAPAVALVAR